MIPYLTLQQRIIAWLLWKLEGFDSLETADVAVNHPEMLGCVSLLRDYYYIKRAGDVE